MSDHPRLDELLELPRLLPRGPLRRLLLHVLDCKDCREKLHGALSSGRKRTTAKVLLFGALADGQEVYPQLDGAIHRALSAGKLEDERGRELVRELLKHPRRRRWVLVANCERYRRWSLAAQLLNESREASFADAHEGEHLARLALALAERLDPDVYGQRLIRDLEARAHATLGNALRLAGDLSRADDCFHAGRACLEGSFDPLEEGSFLTLLASLRRDQRRFDEALAYLERAIGIFEEVRANDLLVRALTTQASLHLDQGAAEEALPPLLKALPLVEEAAEPRTAMAIQQNLAMCYAELGRYHEAQRIWSANRRYYDRFGDRWTQLKAQWLEGIIAAASGRAEHAEGCFTRVRDRYLEEGLAYDAAMVSLDLAMLYAEQGRAAELESLAAAMLPVFASHDIHREAKTALSFFRRAVEMRQATVGVVRRVASYLKKSRLQPELSFEV